MPLVAVGGGQLILEMLDRRRFGPLVVRIPQACLVDVLAVASPHSASTGAS